LYITAGGLGAAYMYLTAGPASISLGEGGVNINNGNNPFYFNGTDDIIINNTRSLLADNITASFKEVSANNLVYNVNNQIISGIKTFTTGIFAPNLVYNTGNQTISGIKTFTTGIFAPYLVYTTGTQTITGFKIFSDIYVVNGLTSNDTYVSRIWDLEDTSSYIDMHYSSINLTPGGPFLTGRINLNGNVYVSKNISAQTGNFDKVFGNNLVYNTGNQTISGIKNFASRPTVNGTGVLLIGEGGGGGGGSFVSPPATPTSAGTQYSLATDSNYLYVCVATNSWKRTALAVW
jgi:hypothetical protein